MKTFSILLIFFFSINIFGQDDGDFLRNMREAESRFAEKDFYGAIQSYTEAIEANPNNALPYYNRGNIKQTIGDSPGALRDYNKALEILPEYAEAYANRGVIKLNLKDERGALKDFDKALFIKPKYSEVYFNRGLCKLRLGMKTLGCLDFSKAGELGFSRAYDAIRELCN